MEEGKRVLDLCPRGDGWTPMPGRHLDRSCFLDRNAWDVAKKSAHYGFKQAWERLNYTTPFLVGVRHRKFEYTIIIEKL